MKNAPLLAALVLVAQVAAGCSSPARGEEPPAPLPPLRVQLAKTSAPSGGALVPATVRAEERAAVSTRAPARVREVLVHEGSRVAKGALLIQLDDADVRAQLRAAQAALQTASALERRLTTLARERAATPSELEGAQAQRALAQSQVDAARAALGYSELRAPFAGVVQSKLVSAGDLAVPGQPLLQLEGRGLELEASLSESESRGLVPGAALPFEAGSARGTARVTAISPGEDSISHRTTLRARVEVAPAGLRQGDFARVELPGAASASLSVPRSALVERGDLSGVFVARDGHAELRWLALGEASADAVAVRAGLHLGEQVIDAPGPLRDGQAIEVSDAR